MEQQPPPEGIRPLRHVYLAITARSLLLLLLAVRGLVRAVRKPSGKNWRILAFDVALPVAVIIAAPRFFRVSYGAMWEAAPDIILTAAVAVLLGMIAAAVKLVRNARGSGVASR